MRPIQFKLRGNITDRVVHFNGAVLSPKRSQRVYNHSPDGFAWGYGGSGPAQLALAILLKFMSVEKAIAHHQRFKFQIIAAIPQHSFDAEITYYPDANGQNELNLL